MDSSEEKYSASPAQQSAGNDSKAALPSQPLSPSLLRAAQAHYVDPTTDPAPFAPPPPVGAGDDVPTLRGYPAPRWPGQSCRYCGWRPVEAGSTCPQCHQPVPAGASWSVPWRPVAIGALSFATVLVVLMAFLLLHHASATSIAAQTHATATARASTTSTGVAVTATTSAQSTGVPAVGPNGTPAPVATTGSGGTPSTPVPGVVGPTATISKGAPTNTPAPSCSWQTKTSGGTYYIYWPGDSTYGLGHYGYAISTTIHYDGCGRAYASADVTSNDDGSPPSFVAAVLYRTADCAGDDKVISQQNTVTLQAGNHATSTTSPTSPGMHCVFAVAIDKNDAGNSQAVTSAIVNAASV